MRRNGLQDGRQKQQKGKRDILTALPVIDVERFGSTAWHPALDQACRTWGCFQIVNHGVPAEVLAATLDAMHRFFALPEGEKRRIERTRGNAWGYFDRELTKNVRDWKEIFDVGPEASEGPMAESRPQWPENLPGFREAVMAYYQAAAGVAARLLEGISANLGMPGGYLGEGFEPEHTSFLRLNHYPLCVDPEAHLGISQHTDAGALTVLLADAEPGLQFFNDGDWRTVAPMPGALTINIGDIVQVWSNDRYAAPLHRVLASAAAERYSAPFFYNPSYRTDYAPLPGVVDAAHPARYRAINWGDFRAGRAAGDYADYGEEIQISHFRIAAASDL
ncbi:MAG: isopenicillin N synthase family dioxygenase [Pseudomonadales bacterium]